MYIQPDGRADLFDALHRQAAADEVLVDENGLSLAAHKSHVPGRRPCGRRQGHVVVAVAPRGDDDEGVGVDGKLGQGVLGVQRHQDVGLGETLLVGELLPVVGDEQAEAQGLCQGRDRFGDMTSATDNHLRRSGVCLKEVLGAVIGDDVLVGAVDHELASPLDGIAVQFRVAQRAPGWCRLRG